MVRIEDDTHLDELLERLELVPEATRKRVLQDSNRYVPMRTRTLERTSYVEGGEIIYPKNYAKDVYYPENHGYTIHTNVNPLATGHWVEHATEEHMPEWKQFVVDFINGAK